MRSKTPRRGDPVTVGADLWAVLNVLSDDAEGDVRLGIDLCSGAHILCTDLPVAVKKLVAALSRQIMRVSEEDAVCCHALDVVLRSLKVLADL
jgi:hypothetical protein